MNTVKKYDVFEVSVSGPSEGNPFKDQWICGTLKNRQETIKTDGFYDGDGVYKVRFMPSFEGEYSYTVESSFGEKLEGAVAVGPADPENHGPVRVANNYHFAYDDGTPHYSIGTTCYVWNLMNDDIIEKTFAELEKGYFNKIRFCIFPKHYCHNFGEPRSYPYVGTPCDASWLNVDNFFEHRGVLPGNDWDFETFNPEHFRHIENCIERLGKLGIEADIILFHPYDRWGFSCMSHEQDLYYLKYVIARYAAYHNVWWSLANEFDLIPSKSIRDWEGIADFIVKNDPYTHLRSIHNCIYVYDHSRPWITHVSYQQQGPGRSVESGAELRTRYKKPVVFDEIQYEGNITENFGNISGEELTRRFWEAAIRGCYAGHGECFEDPDDIIWWSHGGELKGTSPERIRFLLQILKETPGLGLMPLTGPFPRSVCVPEQPFDEEKAYYLYYYGQNRPNYMVYRMDPDKTYEAEVIDTWEMTVTKAGTFSGTFRIDLPGKEYMAVRLRRIS